MFKIFFCSKLAIRSDVFGGVTVKKMGQVVNPRNIFGKSRRRVIVIDLLEIDEEGFI